MAFYHGSRDDGITQLTTSHTKDGFVYATSSRLVALTYAARSFPNLFSTSNGKECFWELKPNLFKKMTQGKSGYIYTLEEKNFEPIPQGPKCGHKNCFKVAENVKVVKKEYIPDVYQELLKYIQSGEFLLVSYKNMDSARREKMTKDIASCTKTLSQEEINDKNNFWKLFVE